MPGGSEWILILICLFFILALPIWAILLYSKNKQLNKQVKTLTEEKNAFLTRLLDKK